MGHVLSFLVLLLPTLLTNDSSGPPNPKPSILLTVFADLQSLAVCHGNTSPSPVHLSSLRLNSLTTELLLGEGGQSMWRWKGSG